MMAVVPLDLEEVGEAFVEAGATRLPSQSCLYISLINSWLDYCLILCNVDF
jgi:hypothetical protein